MANHCGQPTFVAFCGTTAFSVSEGPNGTRWVKLIISLTRIFSCVRPHGEYFFPIFVITFFSFRLWWLKFFPVILFFAFGDLNSCLWWLEFSPSVFSPFRCQCYFFLLPYYMLNLGKLNSLPERRAELETLHYHCESRRRCPISAVREISLLPVWWNKFVSTWFLKFLRQFADRSILAKKGHGQGPVP